MRVVICGDSHIGAIYGLGGSNGKGGNTRIDDYEKTINYIADYCIENKVDAFVQTGDAFDKRNPTANQMEILDKVLKKLSFHNIFSVVIMGNHDYKKSGPVFTSSITGLSARDYPNVRTILEPEIISISKNQEQVNLLLLPYRDRRLYSGKSTKEDSFLYEEEVQRLLSEKLDGPIIGIGHNFFYEGSYTAYGGSELLPRISAFKKCDMIAMGHYHDFKILKKSSPIAIYTGAMERINFGDADSQKVFIDYDTNAKKVKVKKAPIRDLWDGTIDLSNSTFESVIDDLEEELSEIDIKDKIVRLKVIHHEKLSSSLKNDTIKKRFYEMGAHYVSKINLEQIYQRIVRDTSILEEKSDFNMFEAFVKDQGFDSEMEKRILKESKTIIG